MPLYLILLTVLSLPLRHHRHVEGEKISCEPEASGIETTRQWVRHYGMAAESTYDFLMKLFYKSNQTHPDAKPGFIETSVGNPTVYKYSAALEIKQAGKLLPMRQLNFHILWHFYHGDSVIIHRFDPRTQQYSAVELGFHTQKFFAVEEPNIWVALEFDDHQSRAYALVGTIVVRETPNQSQIKFASREDMLEQFPAHAKIINELFDKQRK